MLSKFLKKIKYINRIRLIPLKLDQEEEKIVNQLKDKGFVILEGFIENSHLIKFKEIIDTELEQNLNFEYPCIAQSKIDENRHSEIIKNYFRFSDLELEKFGITFGKDDEDSYEKILEKYKPSTLKLLIPDNDKFINLWLNTKLLRIIESYLGVKPYLLEAYLRRNFPAKYKVMNHFWHRDTNHPDFLLKVFFFFSDCDLENGPHEYISGSVFDRTLDNKPYYSDSEVDSVYPEGSGNRIVSVVKAGTVIIEDTRGLHRARVPKSGYRDLGYAVFLPMPFFHSWSKVFYTLSNQLYKKLSKYQKSFIHKQFIRK